MEDADAAQKVICDLQGLLSKAQGQSLPSERDDSSEDLGQSLGISSPQETNPDDHLSLDDAENPLQLLARASDLQLSPAGLQKSPFPLSQSSSAPADNRQPDGLGGRSFFVPVRANRDIGPDVDPIEMGIVTLYEADSLFSLYVHLVPDKFW